MTLYKHVLTVVVLSDECSPDRVERHLENAFRSGWFSQTSVSATTDTSNRQDAPAIHVPDRPRRHKFPTDADYFTALDVWSDGLPHARDLT